MIKKNPDRFPFHRNGIFLPLLVLVAATRLRAEELILAGWDEVFIVDGAGAETGGRQKRRRWSGQGAAETPDEARKEYHHLDESNPSTGIRNSPSARPIAGAP